MTPSTFIIRVPPTRSRYSTGRALRIRPAQSPLPEAVAIGVFDSMRSLSMWVDTSQMRFPRRSYVRSRRRNLPFAMTVLRSEVVYMPSRGWAIVLKTGAPGPVFWDRAGTIRTQINGIVRTVMRVVLIASSVDISTNYNSRYYYADRLIEPPKEINPLEPRSGTERSSLGALSSSGRPLKYWRGWPSLDPLFHPGGRLRSIRCAPCGVSDA